MEANNDPRRKLVPYSRKLGDEICELIMAGQSIRAICEKEGMPAKGTLLGWVQRRRTFGVQYMRAMRIRAELYAEEIVELADQADDDRQNLNALKLKIDARKWAAARMLPKKYWEGDEDDTEGEKPGSPRVVVVLPENFREGKFEK